MRKQIQGIKIWQSAMRVGTMAGCHQMPERSFFIKGWQLPVCARCTGVFIGQLVALASPLFLMPSAWYVLLAIPLMIDGVTQHFNLRRSNNRLRFITGLLAGFGLTVALLKILIHSIKWIYSFLVKA